MNTATLKQQIDQKPMNAFQWSVVTICICLNIIDGFDVLVMAFTASAVAKEWGCRARKSACSAQAYSAWPPARLRWRRKPTNSAASRRFYCRWWWYQSA
nr:hypothetical protein [Neisseria weixii]